MAFTFEHYHLCHTTEKMCIRWRYHVMTRKTQWHQLSECTFLGIRHLYLQTYKVCCILPAIGIENEVLSINFKTAYHTKTENFWSFLSASVSVSTTATVGTNVYTVTSFDAENDQLFYNMTCIPDHCPFTIFQCKLQFLQMC